MTGAEEETPGPVIRDRRRIDPVTGQAREQGGKGARHAAAKAPGSRRGSPGPGGSRPADAGDGSADGRGGDGGGRERPQAADNGGTSGPDPAAASRAEATLAERTADLQRLQAEYANYRKRVERDRTVVREQALAAVLSGLLSVLDDVGRAREHGELTGGFRSVAESLEAAVAKLGLTTYCDAGDPFDPAIHEALSLTYSPDVTEAVCARVLMPGYKVGDRILRPARVAVAEPADPVGARPGGDASDGPDGPAEAAGAGHDASDEPASAPGTGERTGGRPGGEEPAGGQAAAGAGPAAASDEAAGASKPGAAGATGEAADRVDPAKDHGRRSEAGRGDAPADAG
jgi:molecular chaperone GrpE